MSSFGTGSLTTSGSGVTLTTFEGATNVQAGTDGLVPGPSTQQVGYVLGAGGDWTLEVKAVVDPNDSTERIATTRFVTNYVANQQLGGQALLSALGDVGIANIAPDQFLQYNANNARWENIDLTLGGIPDVDLAGLQDGNALVYSAAAFNGAGGWVPGQGGGGGAANLNDLGDVTIAGGAEFHFLVRNAQGQYVNRLISSADLSDTANIALLNAVQTFSANTTFTADVILGASATATTQAANDNSTSVATTQYTDRQVSDSITALGLGTASTNATGDFLASGSSLTNLADVTTNAPVAKHFLVSDALGIFANRTISSSDLSDTANIPLLNANQTFTGTVQATTQAVDDNSTALATTAFVQQEIGNASIADLADVHNLVGVQAGDVLAWTVNNRFEFTAPAQTYTDEMARNASGTALAGGNHTGITFANNDPANTIDATVSLAGFSITDLSDVANGALVNGKILKVVGGVLTQADETDTNTQLSDEQVQDIVGTMVAGNTETGISVTYNENDGAGVGNGKLDFAVSLAGFSIDDLSDVNTAGFGDGKILKYNNGVLEIADETDTNTQLSDNQVKDIVGGQMLGGTETGITVTYDAQNRNIDFVVSLASADLTDTANVSLLDANQTLSGDKTFTGTVDLTGATTTVQAPTQNAHPTTKTYVDTLVAGKQDADASLDTITGIVDGNLLLGNGPDSFEKIAVTAGVETILKGSGSVGTLGDVTLQAGATGDVLRVSAVDGQNVPTAFVNTKLASTDLSDTADLVRTTAGATFGASTYDFTGATAITVPAPTANTHAATKLYVDNKFAVGGGVSDLDDLDDVTIGAKADAQILVLNYTNDGNDVNDIFHNVSLSGDLTITNAGVATIANNAVTTVKILNGEVTNAKLANSSLTIGSTAISLGGTSTTISGLTGIDFVNQNTVIGASITDDGAQNPTPTTLTLGGAGSKVIIAGDLEVSGSTTTVSTTNLDVKDTVISLNNGVAGASGTDIGLFLDRGTSDPALIIWDEGDDVFKVATHTGVVDSTEDDFSSVGGLTLAPLQVSSPAGADSSNLVATTAWVQGEIGNLATDLTDLGDVTITQNTLATGQTIRYAQGGFVNAFLSANDLSDVQVGANVASQVLRNDGNGFINAQLAHSDLSDSNLYAALASPNFTGNPTAPNQNALTNNSRIANTAYVDSAVTAFGNTLGTASTNNTGDFLQTANNLSEISGAGAVAQGTARTNLGLGSSSVKDAGTGADEVLLLTNANTLPALGGANLTSLPSISVHSDVSLANPSDGQTLRVNAQGTAFENSKLASTDLSDTAQLARLAGPTFTGVPSAPTAGADTNTTQIATTAFVQQEIGNASVGDLSNVTLANEANGDFLKWTGAEFENVQPVVADITDSGSAATKNAGTGADEVLLLAQASTLPALDGTALTGLLKAAENLNDVANKATARSNLGLTTTATTAITALLQAANALSEIAALGAVSQANARTNIGLGTVSTLDSGNANGNVPVLTAQGLPAVSGVNLSALGSIGLHSDVDLTNIQNDEFLKYSNGTFVRAAAVGISTDDARNAVGTALEGGQHSGVTGITFTNDDANDEIDLTLSVQTSDLTDISANAPGAGQILVYNDQNNTYEPSAISTSVDGVGTQANQIPSLSSVALTRTNEVGDLLVYGRVMEVIDYGSVDEVFDDATDWALDFQGTGFGDTVTYAEEDYGVLVV